MKSNMNTLEDLIRKYEQASRTEKRARNVIMSQKTWTGIDLLMMVYSEIYSRKTGIPKRISKEECIAMAVDNTVRIVLEEIRKAAEEQKKGTPTGI